MTFLNWVTIGYLFCKIECRMLITSVLSWLERLHGMQEVVGSTPISSTKNQPPSPSNKGLWFLRGVRSFDELQRSLSN